MCGADHFVSIVDIVDCQEVEWDAVAEDKVAYDRRQVGRHVDHERRPVARSQLSQKRQVSFLAAKEKHA